jgi:hypothetical protein
MSKENKIKEEQLQKIVKGQNDLNQLLCRIGAFEAEKSVVLAKVHEKNNELEDFKQELQKEYGAINIDLKDGSYTLVEEKKD